MYFTNRNIIIKEQTKKRNEMKRNEMPFSFLFASSPEIINIFKDSVKALHTCSRFLKYLKTYAF